MLAGAWSALCRTRDSEKPRGEATGSAVPEAGRHSRCRSRSRRRAPKLQEVLQKWAVLFGGAKAAPSTVPDRLPPSVAAARRRRVLSVRHRAQVLQSWFCQSAAPKIETTTDLGKEPSDR